MSGDKDGLQKEDLFLLLESYKNSVEMNTLISQQLRTISELIQQRKEETSELETNLKERIDKVGETAEKVRDKLESHNAESIKGIGKLGNKVYLLYIGVGSIVLSLIGLIFLLLDKFKILESIATKVGV